MGKQSGYDDMDMGEGEIPSNLAVPVVPSTVRLMPLAVEWTT
jgi:hypothetical protein